MRGVWSGKHPWFCGIVGMALCTACGGSEDPAEAVDTTAGGSNSTGPVTTAGGSSTASPTSAVTDTTGSVTASDTTSTTSDATASSATSTGAGGASTTSSQNSATSATNTATITSTTGDALPAGAPAPGEYGELASLPESNSEMAVAEVDGIIYVLGGYPSSRVTQTTVQSYDPAADTWAVVEPLPVAIHHPVAVGHASRIYSLGGQTDNGDTDRTLVYDPSLDTWTDLAAMLAPRGGGAAAVIGDQIYVAGGRPPAMNAFEVYDVSDDAWTPLPDLPTDFNDRNHIAAAAIGGKVYVAGGRYDGGSFSSPMTDVLDVYDPATGMWTRAAPMLRPRGGVNGIAAYGCFHVWGGEGANTGEPNDVFPDHDVYNPLTDQWTSVAPLPTPVHGVTGAAFVNGLIYMPGGGVQQGGSSGSNIFQVFNPAMRCE